MTYVPVAAWLGRFLDRDPTNILRYRWSTLWGCLLATVGYFMLGPLPVGGEFEVTMRSLAWVIAGLSLLGVSAGITLIAPTPYMNRLIELQQSAGAGSDKSPEDQLKEKLALVANLYNMAYSGGCAAGPAIAGVIAQVRECVVGLGLWLCGDVAYTLQFAGCI